MRLRSTYNDHGGTCTACERVCSHAVLSAVNLKAAHDVRRLFTEVTKLTSVYRRQPFTAFSTLAITTKKRQEKSAGCDGGRRREEVTINHNYRRIVQPPSATGTHPTSGRRFYIKASWNPRRNHVCCSRVTSDEQRRRFRTIVYVGTQATDSSTVSLITLCIDLLCGPTHYALHSSVILSCTVFWLNSKLQNFQSQSRETT